ncbi:MAG: helix-turn-helix domain-containing protein [Burkholderiales bacterium]|nr:MAG: helix-turn-helix domain-containing protein [Burkholderiales bacterium]
MIKNGRELRPLRKVAVELGFSRATMYRLHTRGKLPLVKLTNGRTMVDMADIDQLIKDSKKPGGGRG